MAAVSEPRAHGVSLSFSNVTKRFGRAPAVDDASLAVEGGTFLTILGASGSGKSTTLMLVAGFLDPDAGEITVDGQSVVGKPPYERDFGVVFQNYALFPHMRVFDNVAFPLKMRRRPRAEIRTRVEETLRLVKLDGLEDRYPRQLSGGQQQRVALGRALVSNPRLLLMDEPLSALDRQLREHMQLELKAIQRRLGITVIYVTHDQTEALVMSDKIAVMRAGRVEQFGPPRELYDRPATRYVAEFLGESNLLEGVVKGFDDGLYEVRCGWQNVAARSVETHNPGEIVTMAIRPERLKVGHHPALANRIEAIVEEAIYIGDALKLRVGTPFGQPLVVKANRESAIEALRPGHLVMLGWDASDTVLINARS